MRYKEDFEEDEDSEEIEDSEEDKDFNEKNNDLKETSFQETIIKTKTIETNPFLEITNEEQETVTLEEQLENVTPLNGNETSLYNSSNSGYNSINSDYESMQKTYSSETSETGYPKQIQPNLNTNPFLDNGFSTQNSNQNSFERTNNYPGNTENPEMRERKYDSLNNDFEKTKEKRRRTL